MAERTAPLTAPPRSERGERDGGPDRDGRRRRRDGNRLAVVDAMLDLYQEGNLRPSVAEVAGRAGLSPRSLFRYFADVDDLSRVAVERQLERARPLYGLDVAAGAPLGERIAAVVAQRIRLFGAVAPAATVMRLQAPFQTALATELRRNRSMLREQLRATFAPELAAMGPTAAGEALAALDVLCSFESVQLLREDQRLAPGSATAALTAALGAVLAVRS